MEKFKMSIVGRPKYGFDPRTKHTSCILNYDLPDLVDYLVEGPNSPVPRKDLKTSNFTSQDSGVLWDTMPNICRLVGKRLEKKGIIKVDSRGRLYVEGIAKFNPEDDITLFDKQKGRTIAMAKARHELIRVQVAIIGEIHNLALHLQDCAYWMMTGSPDLAHKLETSFSEIQRAVDLPIETK